MNIPATLTNWHNDVRFEVFTAVTMKNVVFWDVALCRSRGSRRFGGTHGLPGSTQHHIPEDDILHGIMIF
jgi:hypothetical protein